LRNRVPVVLALVVAAACARRGPRAAERPAVVALVGDQPVEYQDFAQYVKSAAGAEPKDVSARVASSLLDQYLEELLLDRAVDDARPVPDGKTREERRKSYLARRAHLEPIPDAELERAYDAHPERWHQPASLRLSQLLFKTKPEADEAVHELGAGTPWLEVSKKRSAAPNAKDGGALGVLSLEDLPRDFARAVASTKEGATTPLLSAPHGFHVFLVEQRTPERTVPFAEAKDAVRVSLLQERADDALKTAIAESRTSHPVRVVEEHLPFPYVGEAEKRSPGGLN
jgi:parvulin-like peptidyl-prolyl isomerase